MMSAAARRALTSEMLVKLVTVLAVASSAAYLAYRATGLATNWWLSVPLLVLELWALTQLILLATMSWPRRRPAPAATGEPPPNVDVVVTCTYQSAGELEHTLVGLRTTRGVGRVVVVCRAGRADIAAMAESFGFGLAVKSGNHVDSFWHGVQRLKSECAAWVEAGQVTMPNFIEDTVLHLADPSTAVVQANVGLLNRESFAHLDTGRDEESFHVKVAFPHLGDRGAAPWFGGGSIVRIAAVREIGGFEINDQAALERALVHLHKAGWNSRYHQGPVLRSPAPDSLDAYLRVRRRRAIESLRVFATPDSPLRQPDLPLRHRIDRVALASMYGTGIRQLGLVLVLIAMLLTGSYPFGDDIVTWLKFLAPALFLATAARYLLAQGTMGVGDWTRQGWRTLAPDLSGLFSVTGLSDGAAPVRVHGEEPIRTLGRLRILTMLLVALELSVVARGVTAFVPDLLPPLPLAGRVVALLAALYVGGSLMEVLQVAARPQRRADFRLVTDLVGRVGGREARVIDLTLSGLGMLVRSSAAPPVGSRHPIGLALPIEGTVQLLQVNGIIRSSAKRDDFVRVGFQFAELEPLTRASLIEYCAIHHARTGDATDQLMHPGLFEVGRRNARVARSLAGSAVVAAALAVLLAPAAASALAAPFQPAVTLEDVPAQLADD